MGTPEFAVGSLKKIIENKYTVKAVITAPDKPAGRGKKIQTSDVKKFALNNNLKVLQPTNLKSKEFVEQLKEINADLFIVVAFRMLPKIVWEMPKLGTFNLHASLLPNYRGAAPINHAIINGDKITGITTFFINSEIDKGNIILQQEVEITNNENAGTLHDKLMEKGADLVVETIKLIQNGNYKVKQQEILEDSKIKPAPKIFKQDCKINWQNKGVEINNKIRGLSPYPTAWSNINDTKKTSVKIFDSEFIQIEHKFDYGKIISDNKNHIKVAVKEGFIAIHELQLQGKKRMKTKDFLNGYKFSDESCFV